MRRIGLLTVTVCLEISSVFFNHWEGNWEANQRLLILHESFLLMGDPRYNFKLPNVSFRDSCHYLSFTT
jgi:hypothetical protein